jgi:hypothetical protein
LPSASGCERQFPILPTPSKNHTSNSCGIDKPFRVFEGKYSILIDMSELEATMSGHPSTMIAHGMHRLPALLESAGDTAVPRETICRLLAVAVHFCALNGTKAG